MGLAEADWELLVNGLGSEKAKRGIWPLAAACRSSRAPRRLHAEAAFRRSFFFTFLLFLLSSPHSSLLHDCATPPVPAGLPFLLLCSLFPGALPVLEAEDRCLGGAQSCRRHHALLQRSPGYPVGLGPGRGVGRPGPLGVGGVGVGIKVPELSAASPSIKLIPGRCDRPRALLTTRANMFFRFRFYGRIRVYFP